MALNDAEDKERIEGECIRCHAPALSETARSEAGREGRMQDLKGSSPSYGGRGWSSVYYLPSNFT